MELVKENHTQKTSISEWFENLIQHLEVEKLKVEKKVASQETQDFYVSLAHGDVSEMTKSVIDMSKKAMIPSILKTYIGEITNRGVNYNKLAFDLSETKILAWVEITDSDDHSEQHLFLSEAKTNALFTDSIFKVSATVVEESDSLEVPSQYHSVNLSK